MANPLKMASKAQDDSLSDLSPLTEDIALEDLEIEEIFEPKVPSMNPQPSGRPAPLNQSMTSLGSKSSTGSLAAQLSPPPFTTSQVNDFSSSVSELSSSVGEFSSSSDFSDIADEDVTSLQSKASFSGLAGLHNNKNQVREHRPRSSTLDRIQKSRERNKNS